MTQPRINNSQIQKILSSKIIVEEFDQNKSYFKDAIIKKDNLVYFALVDIEPGEFDISQWKELIEYFPGTGINISNNIISTKDIPSDLVLYENDEYPEIKTLQDALNTLLYINPIVNITGGGIYEIGTVLEKVELTWEWNKEIKSQSLNQGIGNINPLNRSYTYDNPISSDISFTINGYDGKKTDSATTDVIFLHKRYWGVSDKTTLTDTEIIELSSELSTHRNQLRTFNCTGGKYFYFAIKSSYCNDIKFKVGGLIFSDINVETRQFTNASGYTDTYNIYRINNIQTGSAIEVEVL